MDNKISSAMPPQAASTPTPGASGKRGAQTAAADAAPVAADNLALTDSARAMQEAASAQASASPSFDAAKVASVRAAIANDSYSVDAGRIADKLVAMERQMGGHGKG